MSIFAFRFVDFKKNVLRKNIKFEVRRCIFVSDSVSKITLRLDCNQSQHNQTQSHLMIIINA